MSLCEVYDWINSVPACFFQDFLLYIILLPLFCLNVWCDEFFRVTSTMVTMGGDLQPGSLADRLLTGLGQPQINP